MTDKPRILVVERDPVLMKQIEATIKQMGAEPLCVASGREAALLANKKKFEGAFLDWDMPELGGEHLTQMIRRSKSNSTIPIAMLTSTQNTKAIAAGFKAGVTFFLSKPFGQLELSRLLNASRGLMLEERRRYRRALVRMAVQCRWGGKTATAQSVDISGSGLLVMLHPSPEMGAKLEVEFNLPRAKKTFEVDADVMRVGPGPQVGLRFLKLPPEQREEIMKFTTRVSAEGGEAKERE